MPDVLIRDVPKKVLDDFRKTARRHGRSLQQELRMTLEDLSRERALAADFAEKARQIRERLLARGGPFGDSTELIRQDRER